MLRTENRRKRSVETQMLAVADRLFDEFDDLPVLTVFRAINGARSQLRADGAAATPDAIEARARTALRHAARPRFATAT